MIARSRLVTSILPIVLPALFAAALIDDGTRAGAKRLLEENQIVELLTFILLVWAGVLALRLAFRQRRAGEAARVWGFYLVFAFFALIVAGEEVAWGQWFVRFQTPEFFLEHNRQRMLTLHNLPGIDARSEILRVAFGFCGLIGCSFARRATWREIAPAPELTPWFASIFTFAAVDFVNDVTALQPRFDFAINALSEFVELLIAGSALLYVATKPLPDARAGRVTVPLGKRGFDFCVAAVALVVLAPLLLLIALLIRVKLGSPVLFRQQRPGLHGRPFFMWKFRTMTDSRDADGRLLPDPERVTPFGNFLRSTSLDELPELINVLRGEMSLVGPRPLLMDYLPLYSAEQMRRHDVLPGVTGWAQINGRNAASWPRK
ncbi:MAG TPA: sugar transferase, partial [Chthoniobacterales bacterium]|nr:sugar transferase [Chthoniobacterales bacterium]